MIKPIFSQRTIFILALIIGGTGAFGQAYLLYHELIDCLPFKEANTELYRNIANTGIFLAPVLAVTAGYFLGLKRFWLSAVIPVLLCPIFFALIFKFISAARSEIIGIFDGKGSNILAQEFLVYTILLSITGLIIAGICNFLLSNLTRQKNF